MVESAPWTSRQSKTVMLTYTHNHAPGILQWQCFCHRNEKQNFKSFFNYDVNLTSVITMELKLIFFFAMLASRYDVIRCTSSMLRTSVKFWATSFKFWLRPWIVLLAKNYSSISVPPGNIWSLSFPPGNIRKTRGILMFPEGRERG